jgi:hypothetical protein
MSVRSYTNNQEIVDKIEALRTCIARRHHAFYKKIHGGLECSTVENVKLTLIAHLLIDYQKNGEDDNTKDCLQATESDRKGWKILNVFLDFVSRECRDCFPTETAYTSGTEGSPTPGTNINFITTSSGDQLTDQGGNPIITN